MSENLKKCMNELKQAMSQKTLKSRKEVLKYLANRDCIYKAMREISINILNSNIPLDKKVLKKLNRHTKTIKALKCGTKSKRRRRELVIQSGGYLPFILPILATVISKLV